jgi:hypothetical protein
MVFSASATNGSPVRQVASGCNHNLQTPNQGLPIVQPDCVEPGRINAVALGGEHQHSKLYRQISGKIKGQEGPMPDQPSNGSISEKFFDYVSQMAHWVTMAFGQPDSPVVLRIPRRRSQQRPRNHLRCMARVLLGPPPRKRGHRRFRCRRLSVPAFRFSHRRHRLCGSCDCWEIAGMSQHELAFVAARASSFIRDF